MDIIKESRKIDIKESIHNLLQYQLLSQTSMLKRQDKMYNYYCDRIKKEWTNLEELLDKHIKE